MQTVHSRLSRVVLNIITAQPWFVNNIFSHIP